jgi:hypothetical protein
VRFVKGFGGLTKYGVASIIITMFLPHTNLLLTLSVVLIVVAGNAVVRKFLPDSGDVQIRRGQIVMTRNISVALGLMCLILIWFDELRTVAVSMLAVSAALIITAREMLISVISTLVRSGSNAIRIGDTIEIRGMRGKVVNQTLLFTTIREIAKLGQQYTGREIQLPNAVFMSDPTWHQVKAGGYMVHSFTLPCIETDWQAAEQRLLAYARAACEPYIERARIEWQEFHEKISVDAFSVEPRVTLVLDPDEKDIIVRFKVRIVVPEEEIARIEQSIIRNYAAGMYYTKAETPLNTLPEDAAP